MIGSLSYKVRTFPTCQGGRARDGRLSGTRMFCRRAATASSGADAPGCRCYGIGTCASVPPKAVKLVDFQRGQVRTGCLLVPRPGAMEASAAGGVFLVRRAAMWLLRRLCQVQAGGPGRLLSWQPWSGLPYWCSCRRPLVPWSRFLRSLLLGKHLAAGCVPHAPGPSGR